jgi:hypothetical protein
MAKRKRYALIDPIRRTYCSRKHDKLAWTYSRKEAESWKGKFLVVVDADELAQDSFGVMDREADKLRVRPSFTPAMYFRACNPRIGRKRR